MSGFRRVLCGVGVALALSGCGSQPRSQEQSGIVPPPATVTAAPGESPSSKYLDGPLGRLGISGDQKYIEKYSNSNEFKVFLEGFYSAIDNETCRTYMSDRYNKIKFVFAGEEHENTNFLLGYYVSASTRYRTVTLYPTIWRNTFWEGCPLVGICLPDDQFLNFIKYTGAHEGAHMCAKFRELGEEETFLLEIGKYSVKVESLMGFSMGNSTYYIHDMEESYAYWRELSVIEGSADDKYYKKYHPEAYRNYEFWELLINEFGLDPEDIVEYHAASDPLTLIRIILNKNPEEPISPDELSNLFGILDDLNSSMTVEDCFKELKSWRGKEGVPIVPTPPAITNEFLGIVPNTREGYLFELRESAV